jgi:glutathione reductase (NADPH)
MTQFDYDLFVIGAGSGGVRAARMAANTGAKVVIAEEYRVGGTCVIRGCVPKKLFVYASRFGKDFKDAQNYGWSLQNPTFDWGTLLANKDKEIDRLNAIYIKNLKASNVQILDTRAVVRGPHNVYLLDEEIEVTARTILIATGGAPFVPGFPGSEHAITSNEAFHLPSLPQNMVIVGGGYIAVEFAGIFSGLGVDVTQLYRGEQILRGFDDDLRYNLADEMTRRGIDIQLNSDVKEISLAGSGYRVDLTNGDAIYTDLVMYATGRTPNTKNLGLEKTGVDLDRKGAVVVDEYSQTSVPSIYAVGDVTDRVNLTPVAIREGMAFVDTVFKNSPTSVDYDNIATAVFSEPELGTVGLTEAQARDKYTTIDIYKSLFKPMKHTISGRDTKTMMKIIVDAGSDRVVGVHIMGPDSGEMAQVLGIAVKMGATKADFDATIALHPTASEELVTMRDKWQPADAKAAE